MQTFKTSRISFADAERRIAELKAGRDEARHLVDQMVEQVSDGPLDASSAQCAVVLKLRKTGKSFRAVADQTGLSLQTVRTIVGRDAGTDRTSAGRLQRIQLDKAASNRERARKRTRDALPRAMAETMDKAGKLLKDAKGLGR